MQLYRRVELIEKVQGELFSHFCSYVNIVQVSHTNLLALKLRYILSRLIVALVRIVLPLGCFSLSTQVKHFILHITWVKRMFRMTNSVLKFTFDHFVM